MVLAILVREREVSNLLTGETEIDQIGETEVDQIGGIEIDQIGEIEIDQIGEIEIVTETSSRKNCSEYTTDDGIHGCLLESFLQLASAPDRTDSPLSTLHEDFVNFIHVFIAKGNVKYCLCCQLSNKSYFW